MPALNRWTDSPREFIQSVYDKHAGEESWQKEIEAHFDSLKNPSLRNSILSLNQVQIKDVRDHGLVRFRAMVQDQLGPELFSAKALLKNVSSGDQRSVTGKYQDELLLGPDEEVVEWKDMGTRHCYYCVPIPGETFWVKKVHEERFSQFYTGPVEPSSGGKKRSLEDVGDEMEVVDSVEIKRPCPTDRPATEDRSGHNVERILNFPLPSSESIGCIVKTYCEEELPLNQVLEVVGVVSFNTPSPVGDQEEEFHPPSSIIPRIHAVSFSLLDHSNPNLCQQTGSDWNQEVSQVLSTASNIRGRMHTLFAQFFGGDELAADYLLCHLASYVYCRKDALAVGKFALNLTDVPVPSTGGDGGESFGRLLFELLEQLVTKGHYLAMSLQNLNTQPMVPKKDYAQNRLVAGRLQLSSQTHLVLDETAMTEGQLLSEGVRNVTALGNVISWQKIDYDFQYHNVEFPCDIPVLIVSQTKSMLPSDVRLPLRMNQGGGGGGDSAALVRSLQDDVELLAAFRKYLTVIRLAPFGLSDAMQEAVQQDFIRSRVPGQGNPMSPEDFHLLLVLSRLLALSCGLSELTQAIWEKAKAMETQRKARIS